MKIKTALLVSCLFVLCYGNLHAQFFKKLKDRAKQAAEETVMRKTEEKASQETDKAFEKVFDIDLKGGGKSLDPSVLPVSYQFDWEYTLKMENKKGSVLMQYFLNENTDAFASKPSMEVSKAMGNMTMIMDLKLGTNTILTERNGTKSGMVMELPKDIAQVNEEMTEEINNYTYKEIGTKEILGHTCQGFEMENEDYKVVAYMMLDAPVTFNGMGANPKLLPKGLDPKWLEKAENSLMMEMQFTHKKKRKLSGTMTCVVFEEKPLEINLSEYDFRFQQAQQPETTDDY